MAVAVAALVAAIFQFDSLFDFGKVSFGVDVATTQLPWSVPIEESGVAPDRVGPRNSDLADQAVFFYPFYRWVVRSWLAGDPPTWCPDVYAGAPGFGNAQAGALNPQVWLLALFWYAGGEGFFDWGLSVLAWMRLVIALSGAFLLARELRLGLPGATLAAVAFGFSGFQILWLNHALGHVSPFLPWVLLGLEGVRGLRPWRSMAGAGLALALAILGGHVETAFYVGAAAGLWALALGYEDRRAAARGLLALALGTLVAAASLLPLYEYLELSAAKYVRELGAEAARGALDLVALGVLFVLAALVLLFRGLFDPTGRLIPKNRWGAVSGLALAVAGTAWFLSTRGLGEGAALALLPDLFGRPGMEGGYRGDGPYLEAASAWIAFPALALALAAAFTPQGPMRRRNLVLGLGAVAFLLSIEAPGLLEAYRFVPVVGLGATVRAAAVGSLFLGLAAGEALGHAPRAARTVALWSLLLCVGGALMPSAEEPLADTVEVGAEQDELFGVVVAPPRRVEAGEARFEGWVAPALPFAHASLVLEPLVRGQLGDGAARFEIPVEIHGAPSSPDHAPGAPAGARWLRTPGLPTNHLSEGHWRLSLELFAADGTEPLGTRQVGVMTLTRPKHLGFATLFFVAFGLALLLVSGRDRRIGFLVVAVSLGHAFHFTRGQNPAIPRAEAFPRTRTEEILATELGTHRFFADAGVLPPSTGLVRGLAGIQGYDAMDVAEFNFYRETVVQPGANALLSWNPRGVDLGNPAFRLYGVGMLALRAPLDHPEWAFVAGPEEPRGGAWAETWIYRAKDPLPRAFCVPRVLSMEELTGLWQSDPRAFDPAAMAAIEGDWRPTEPFTTATVTPPEITNGEVSLVADLDGDGLLVLTDQAFPGWKVFVDGRERDIETANMIFRAVPLQAGRHRVSFRYEPKTIRIGALASALGLAGLVGLFLWGVFGRHLRLRRADPLP